MRIMVFGVGAFAHSVMTILKEHGVEVGCYLTRDYGHYGPASTGKTWLAANHPSPIPVIEEFQPDYIIPMAIAWKDEPWAEALLETQIPLLCPIGETLKIESERQFAEQLCRQYGIPFPASYTVSNRLEAFQLMEKNLRPYPRLPITQTAALTCDLWWNEVEAYHHQIYTAHHKLPIMGHRIAECSAYSNQLEQAIQQTYENMKKIRCLGSYYRLDIGDSFWPPGSEL